MPDHAPPIPAAIAHRPTQGGYVLPYANVSLADGGVDFRSAHQARWELCWRNQGCQVCGKIIEIGRGERAVLMGGPDELANLVFDEPPLHAECAGYTSVACPMVAGQRERFAERPRVAEGSRGKRCHVPGCDCGGWVSHEGRQHGRDGQPAHAWFAVWVSDYALAAGPDGSLQGGIVLPEQVLKVRVVSRPGEGRIWRTVVDWRDNYRPPQMAAPPEYSPE